MSVSSITGRSRSCSTVRARSDPRERLHSCARVFRMSRVNVASGTPWEPIVGYSRAGRVGNVGSVSGTTATDDSGRGAGAGDMRGQAVQTLGKVERGRQGAGATLADVVRTRMSVPDISRWEEVGRVHGEFFGAVRPATSMVEVSRLIDPDMLVEIEAEAILPGPPPRDKVGRGRTGSR